MLSHSFLAKIDRNEDPSRFHITLSTAGLVLTGLLRSPQLIVESTLDSALRKLARRVGPSLWLGARALQDRDGEALTTAERVPYICATRSVLRASGAARIVARRLLLEAGAVGSGDLVRSASGAPSWPAGYTGSLAHDEEFAVAAVAPLTAMRGVGIDVEPALPLPSDMLTLVATSCERAALREDRIGARLLFALKEAVFKATSPVDGKFLEPHDVEVDWPQGLARTRTGHQLAVYALRAPRLVAVAILSEDTNEGEWSVEP